MLGSRLMLGVEADASFPNSIAGTSTAMSNTGIASYGDTVLGSGTARGRVGYVLDNNWLVYGTGGFPWSYDQMKRTQLAGGTLPPGTDEGGLLWRFGWTAGAGVEIPVAPSWSARLEYLYTGFGNRSRDFNASGDAFNSSPSVQEVRLGLDYKLSADAPGKGGSLIAKPPSLSNEQTWAVHGQTTFVEQYAAPFHAPYGGPNSLASNSGRETWDATAYLGLRLWTVPKPGSIRKSTRVLD